jgi:monothiol glutaredoxin
MSDDLRSRIKEIIETEDVVLFMKGTPQWAMCGNSMRALEALRAAEAPIAAVDILPNPEYRKELSALSGWPTIPQVFVKGELIGGADIVEELEQSGDLERTLEERLGGEYRESRDEKTVSVI